METVEILLRHQIIKQTKTMYSKFKTLLITLLIPVITNAQKFTVSGSLKDASNGEDLIGATVTVKELPGVGAAANVYGFYSLTLPQGNYSLLFQYIGYTRIEERITLDKNITLNKQLSQNTQLLNEVVVTAERENSNVTSTQASVVKLDPKSIETIPVLFGEKDIIKTMQLTPGVKAAGEGNAGFYVRGGGIDQNLILLDEAPVYNASHLLGFFSVFNSDALNDVTLYKSSIPAQYSGRASSVLDVKMKEGNNKRANLSGGIGLISSRLTFEAPIVKEKGSFIISARRTYADAFLKLSSDTNYNKSKIYFYDLNFKANYSLTQKDRLFLSGYFGRDVLGLRNRIGVDWGNATGTVRWNHLYSERLFSNTSFIFSNYDYKFKIGENNNSLTAKSSIRDWNVKQDFSYFTNNSNAIKFGANGIHHTFLPGTIDAEEGSNIKSSSIDKRNDLEGGIYLENEQNVSQKISLQYGIRYSFFNFIGQGTAYTFDSGGNEISHTEYQKGKSIKSYGGLEPRISGRYLFNEKSSIKIAYNRNYQYLHLLSNSTTSSPTDLWIASSNIIKPQIVDQYSLGYFRNFKNNKFEFSVEAYYKDLQNQIDYRNGAELVFNGTVESQLVFGKGKAYGTEFYLKKTKGKLTGWISYTLSRSLRKFDEINNGKYFSARQDRIHDLSIVAMYSLSTKLKVSATWVFNTGDAVTFPSGRYESAGMVVPYYTERNGYRMPNYHRFDFALTWYRKSTATYESSWNFSVFNAYGRHNAYSIDFRQNKDNPAVTEAVRTSLFSFVPSLTYNFKFK